LKTIEEVFQTVVNEHSRRVAAMGNTTTIFFETPADEFEEKSNLLEELEEELKALPHTTSSTYVNQLLETNAQLTREVAHL
jgi:hypothetical protein